jgi:hypothetical protein
MKLHEWGTRTGPDKQAKFDLPPAERLTHRGG